MGLAVEGANFRTEFVNPTSEEAGHPLEYRRTEHQRIGRYRACRFGLGIERVLARGSDRMEGSFMLRIGQAICIGLLGCLGVRAAVAQESDRPDPVALVGGRVVVSADRVIDDATIILRDGRITSIGKDIPIPPDAERIDAESLTIYPGFIDAHTRVGLPKRVRSDEQRQREEGHQPDPTQGPFSRTREAYRRGIHPDIRAERLFTLSPARAAADSPQSALDAHRKAGFTTALIAPPGILGGRSAVVNLSDLPTRRALLRTRVAQHASFRNDEPGGYPRSLMGVIALFRQVMLDAQHHLAAHRANGYRTVTDVGLDALGDVLSRRMPLVFEASSANEIHRALDLAEEFDLEIVIAGGREAWRVVDRLKAGNVPVLVSLKFDDEPDYGKKAKPPGRKGRQGQASQPASANAESTDAEKAKAKKKEKEEKPYPLKVAKERRRRWEEQVANIVKLHEAGLRLALSTNGMSPGDVLDNVRRVIERGLPADVALDVLTRSAAELLGIDATVGTLETGKAANLTILTAPLEKDDAKVRYVFVDGRKFEFDAPDGKPDESSDKKDDPDDEEKAADAPKPDEPNWPTWAAEIKADRIPATRTGGSVLIRGATILTVTRGTIENGSVLIRNGKIAYVGLEPPEVDGITVIDAAGLYVSPGIVDCHSHIAMNAVNEGTLSVTSECRIADVLNPDDVAIYRAVAGGTTCANLLHGSANPIGGQNAVVKFKYGRTADEMLFKGAPAGIKFALGENVKRSNSSRGRSRRFPATRMGVEITIRRTFEAARAYAAEWQRFADRRAAGHNVLAPRRDLRLEALAGVMRGDILVHCHCYRADEILRLLGVAEDYGFRVATLQHVLEGYKVAHEMARHGCGGSTFADYWSYKLEAYDAVPHNAALMHRAGVNASVNSDSAALIRLMGNQAAIAMRYGRLNANQALSLITINPARQLGIDDRVGSLEVGKDGDVALFTGHPLDTFARCVMTLIDGEVYFEDPRAVRPTTPRPFNPKRQAPQRIRRDADTYAIVGAEIHPVTTPVIPEGTVLIDGGRITAFGATVNVPDGAVIVEAKGLKVYPGLIDAGSVLGLTEIGAVNASRDNSEIAGRQPDARAISAVHPDSAHINGTRLVGITTALTAPRGGEVAGQSAIIDLDGWTAAEMARVETFALHVAFPSRSVTASDKEKKRFDKRIKDLTRYFDRARRYASAREADEDADTRPRDLQLEAMAPYARGDKPVVLGVRNVPSIRAAIKFGQDNGLKIILSGAGDAWKIADEIAEADVPVIIGTCIWETPRGANAPWDSGYRRAAVLHKAGVRFAFGSGDASKSRYLPYDAGISAAYGLPADAALRSVTIDAADILGQADRIGSIDVGKDANLIVCTANPLQAVNDVVYLFINGKPVALESKQTRQARRYARRPKPTLPVEKQLVGLPSQSRRTGQIATDSAAGDPSAQ